MPFDTQISVAVDYSEKTGILSMTFRQDGYNDNAGILGKLDSDNVSLTLIRGLCNDISEHVPGTIVIMF